MKNARARRKHIHQFEDCAGLSDERRCLRAWHDGSRNSRLVAGSRRGPASTKLAEGYITEDDAPPKV